MNHASRSRSIHQPNRKHIAMDTNPRLLIGTFPDGSQLLITEWDTGTVTAATRPSSDTRVTWGPPIRLEPAP